MKNLIRCTEIQEEIYKSELGKRTCFKCKSFAVWMYAPGKNEPEDFYCDVCVPRGCSCQVIDYPFNDDVDYSDPNLPQRTDELGRLLPCVEYWFDDEGFEAG